MKIKAINYDLQNGDIEDYHELIAAIKTVGIAHHAQKSFWLVKTGKNSKEIRDLLTPYLKDKDQLMVSTFSEWACFQMPKTAEWLNKK